MKYLVDTNVLSELRKGDRGARSVQAWYLGALSGETFVSVLALGELRRGIEGLRERDLPRALNLERWFDLVVVQFEANILPVTLEIANLWGGLCLHQPLPPIDGLLAATALVHDLTLVTRNTRDFERSGVRMINPFSTP